MCWFDSGGSDPYWINFNVKPATFVSLVKKKRFQRVKLKMFCHV